MTHYIAESRAIEVGALEAALRRTPAASKLPPTALAIFATSVALTLIRERQLGIETGHAEVIGVIEGFLGKTEAS